MAESQDKLLHETPYLRLVDRQGWCFVQRHNATGVVTVVAVTEQDELLLVEQYRPTLQRNVVELPAGLCGDHDAPDESLETAARELLEETGFAAERLQRVFEGPTSAGLTDEMVTFFLARNVTRRGPGGGVESEQIIVHRVPLSSIDQWLAGCTNAQTCVDSRVYTGLYLLRLQRSP